MRLKEFLEQDEYCQEHNTPEGTGCGGCPALDRKYCADALIHLCGKWLDKRQRISRKLDECYGVPLAYQDSFLKGIERLLL